MADNLSNPIMWQKALTIFSPATPIDTAGFFNGRKEQINSLIKAILEKGKHAVLYGERGVGKTSLSSIVHFLIHNPNIVRIRKQASPEDDYSSLWKKVFRDLHYSASKENAGFINNVQNFQISLADNYPSKITSDDVLRELQKIPMGVIIFDEFDKIEDAETKKLMSHTIKLLSDMGVNTTIIIVGVAADINALVEGHESITRNIEQIKMPRMSSKELEEVLDKRLPDLGLSITNQAKKMMVTLSRGLPEYMHALGKNVAIDAIDNNKNIIDEEDVVRAIKTFLKQSDHSSSNSFRIAIQSNRKNAMYNEVLLACALATDEEGNFTPTDVIKPLSDLMKRKISLGNFQAPLEALCSKKRGNILEKNGVTRAFKYRFREPKMQPYVIMEGIASEKIKSDSIKLILE